MVHLRPVAAQDPVGRTMIAAAIFLQVGWLPIYRAGTEIRSDLAGISDGSDKSMHVRSWNQHTRP